MTITIEQLAEAMDAAYWKARGSSPRGIKHEWGINAEKRRCWIEAARIAVDMLGPVGGEEAGVERAANELYDGTADRCEYTREELETIVRAIIAAYLGRKP